MKYTLLLSLIVIAGMSVWSGSDKVAQEGGLVQISGKGWIAAIDCRGGEYCEYSNGIERIRGSYGIDVKRITGGAFSLSNASRQLKTSGANVAVFIVDDESLPPTLLALEEKWSLINAAKMKTADKSVLSRRMSLLLIRQALRVIGTDSTTEPTSVFYQSYTPEDIDKINGWAFPAGVFVSVNTSMPRLGMEQIEMVTYKDACELGIAPKPTNDVQRAIWEKVHAPPKTPLKIQFDPATQKGKVTK